MQSKQGCNVLMSHTSVFYKVYKRHVGSSEQWPPYNVVWVRYAFLQAWYIHHIYGVTKTSTAVCGASQDQLSASLVQTLA